jgi:dethiobiotin synthase
VNNSGYFITGTDTGVGKTVITLGLMQHFRQQGKTVAAMKPVASGCEQTAEGLRNDDALQLMQQSSITTWSTPMPLSRPSHHTLLPHSAASGLSLKKSGGFMPH